MPQKKLQITNYKLQIPSGFSLLELLITVSIITVVFGVIITSSFAIRANSRDTQRTADLRNIQSALQEYYADQNYFPLRSSGAADGSLTFGSRLKSPDGSKKYSDLIPNDPVSTSPTYCYIPLATSASTGTTTDCNNGAIKCHYYKLLAKLENPSSGATSYTVTDPLSYCSTAQNAYNLQVTPL